MHDPSLLTMIVGLFAMTGPIAALPVYISATEGQSKEDQRETTYIIAITFIIFCFVALFAGTEVLKLFGVREAGLRAAGMGIIATIGWDMLNAPTVISKSKPKGKNAAANKHKDIHHMASNTHIEQADDDGKKAPAPSEVGIMPLGFPLYAGPGVISVIISWSSLSSHIYERASLAILVNAAIIIILNFLANPISRLVGPQGLLITEKVFGLIVLAIAVTGIADALLILFPGLAGFGF